MQSYFPVAMQGTNKISKTLCTRIKQLPSRYDVASTRPYEYAIAYLGRAGKAKTIERIQPNPGAQIERCLPGSSQFYNFRFAEKGKFTTNDTSILTQVQCFSRPCQRVQHCSCQTKEEDVVERPLLRVTQ
jgi:hypothetical protein